MTIDAVRAGLRVEERELPLRHRATGRDAGGFAHRARQLLDAALACGPTAINYRGLRLPLVGALVALGGGKAPARVRVGVAGIALLGLADDLWSGPERGFRAHLRQGLDHRRGEGGRDPAGRAGDDALAAEGHRSSRSPRTR